MFLVSKESLFRPSTNIGADGQFDTDRYRISSGIFVETLHGLHTVASEPNSFKSVERNDRTVAMLETVNHPLGGSITKTRLYNFDPLKPHFYIVKLGFTGVYVIFLISAKKHRLWVLVRTASLRRF